MHEYHPLLGQPLKQEDWIGLTVELLRPLKTLRKKPSWYKAGSVMVVRGIWKRDRRFSLHPLDGRFNVGAVGAFSSGLRILSRIKVPVLKRVKGRRAIVGFPEYEIDRQGNIFTTVARPGSWYGRQVKKDKLKCGYWRVCLSRDRKPCFRLVHRLLLLTFGKKPKANQEACHNDGVKGNIALSNLRWGTRAENQKDRVAHGTHNRGVRHGMHKLTEEQVLAIRSNENLSRKQLAVKFSVSIWTIDDIINNKRWKHLL